ncbi:hypothetical protein K488DRAFT_60562 [Vararia minispora EC-137]|uniref:Uncharacterized protein n=1 Tax=Vararia minispora EC-137 TaxID=1314806 RepID=A0ACB8Q945_9AGAM|nr:hypothetical protein K488DRAFT_60562 [Vararia minispora EC-137]
MSQHPYARAYSSVPDPLQDGFTVQRTASVRSATSWADKPRPDKHPLRPTASLIEIRPQAAPVLSMMSVLGPQHRRHFVKQENSVTLVLSGHSGINESLAYTSGSIIRGLVTLSRPENIVSIVVNLEGTLKVRELQGGTISTSAFLCETLYTWNNSVYHDGAPPEFNFETTVPVFVPPASERRVLPPSYENRASAIPGFRVSVQYEFVVSVTRHTNPMDFWKKRTRYAYLQLFLPQSQIIPLGERITFQLTLRAPDPYLAPVLRAVAAAQPLVSFLPIPSSPDTTRTLFELASRTQRPLNVRLERRVKVDARDTGGFVFGRSRGRKFDMTEILPEAHLHQEKYEKGKLNWGGFIDVPDGVSCASFVADRLSVQDFLVVSVDVPGMRTHEFPFRQRIPMRLTSHSAKTIMGEAVVGEVEIR